MDEYQSSEISEVDHLYTEDDNFNEEIRCHFLESQDDGLDLYAELSFGADEEQFVDEEFPPVDKSLGSYDKCNDSKKGLTWMSAHQIYPKGFEVFAK